ncbi:FtsK/SpoIIIE family DNA translocase [Paenibacillus jilunlii]|uniref:Cell division protein FtsK n=1 Tax=Paenibacillus jilunlii TaxID=682956 RepID=A0A1G9N318_9BACL|nr:DNA translocase FtsK [Paenibacillus jilunlii]KWX75642.1 cell division protein FtsK [Paenibacillus jilunlii]SDL80966.1 DNA segregation ATPase FtsK/SpoIIIE, S-DNA-T family [Paenibacillus jilunlii]
MAKRRKKKKKALLGSVLKYEIYGIMLITISVIALSGEAAVGRSLSNMSGYLFGRFYFVLPLVGIFYGLMVMIHRRWPSKWTSRHSGALLLVLSMCLMSTISAMEQKLGPLSMLHPGNVLAQIHNDLSGSLSPGVDGSDVYMLGKDISGGYVGALEYAALLWLFGSLGAKLLMIVMLAISFMLITNLSYVELFTLLRVRVVKLVEGIRQKAANRPAAVPVNSRPARTARTARTPAPQPVQDDDDEDEDEQQLPSRSQPQFLRRIGGWFSGGARTGQPAGEGHSADEDADVVLSGTPSGPIISGYPGGDLSQLDDDEDYLGDDTEPVTPIIRDFFEHIRAEGLNAEDREEWSEFSPAARSGAVREAVSGTPPVNGGIPAVEDVPEEELAPLELNGLLDSAEGGEPVPVPLPPPPKPYKLPPFRLLAKPNNGAKSGDQNDYMQTARKLEATLESFGVRAKVLEVVRGPAVTRYEIQPDIGVKVSRIVNLTDDIALALAAKDIRMEAPIPGKSAIGIEVPNPEVSVVTMREVMETQIFQDAESRLSIAFGRDISGQTIVGNLAKMPHLLVAGATGSGKSVCINGIITSILYKAKPNEVKFLMVDPKMVELNVYNGIPHLLAPVVTDPKRASLALKKIVVEMEKRYELFSKSGTRNVEGYNNLMKDNPAAVLPYIVVIVDELADLMMVAANDVEDAICRLAQMARAAGIHLIIATQRPSVDVITGLIKANIPSRIAFGVSSNVDSRTILDMPGAEKLLGRGDMLFLPMGASKPIRVQGAFMSDQEVETIVQYVSSQGEANYDESIVPEVDDTVTEDDEPQDELYEQAVQIVLEAKQASVSLLQRRMRVGYTRAARLIDAMEARSVIGPYEGSKPREVLMSLEQYQHNRISS